MPGASREGPPWLAAAAVAALAAAVRALRFWDGFASWSHPDDVSTAVPATQILGGTFPVHHVGVEYHGAAPSYPLAVWFALTGPSTLALDVFGWIIGIGIAWTGYLLACRLVPRWPAFLAGLVLAAPPLVFTRWTTTGNLVYPFTLLLGNLILLGTLRTFGRRPAGTGAVLVTGLLAGLGWWTNPLVIVYCAPFGVLALRTAFVLRRQFWLFPLGVGLGGLPDWLYEIVSFPSARLVVHEAGSVVSESLAERVTTFLGALSPELVGARATELATVMFNPPRPAQAIVVGLGILVVARAVVRDRRELAWLVGARAYAAVGLSALWILLAANLVVTLPTKRTLGITYFLPLYAVLPLWTGEFLAWLWGIRRGAGATLLLGLLGFHVWATWTVTLGRRTDPEWRWSEVRKHVEPVAGWLSARGMRHIYYQYEYQRVSIPAFEFTFLTGMRITAAHPWHEHVVPHGQAVDAQISPPFVISAEQAEEFRETLAALGRPVRETRVGTVVVFETGMAPPGSFTAISPDRWTVTTSHRPLAGRHLVDRDAATQWSTGRTQSPGQWVAVDLGVEEEIARVDLLALDWQEVPAGFRVEWSGDGQLWREAASVGRYWGPLFFSDHHPFLRVRRGRIQAVFAPVRARFLRIAQTARSQSHPWSARELFVYRPAPPRTPDPEPVALTERLRREGVRFAYASHWLSARILAESGGSVGALDSNINVNSYGRTRPAPPSLERFRLEAGRALLAGADVDLAGIRRMLARRGALERETSIGPHRLLLLKRPAVPRPLARNGWRLGASVAANTARALDGDPGTRWSAGSPVGPDAFVTLDLGRQRPVGGVRLVPGSRDGGPSAFALESSPDGLTWSPIRGAEWMGPLYWTGYELLGNSRREWNVGFPPVDLRHLRIRPAEAARTWDLEEIDLFE